MSGPCTDESASVRYVVSRRMAGLGDRLICLCAAWIFARATGRTLVADWRFSRYLPTDQETLFPRCFEATPVLAGVPFVGDQQVASLDLPKPRHPALWNDDALLAAPHRRPVEAVIADRDAAVALIHAGDDVAAPTVVFDACINGAVVSLAESRTFLRELRPVPELTRLVTAFRGEHLGDGPTIGLHARFPNGEVTGHAPYWEPFETGIDRCVRAVDLARERLGRDAPVLLCTDSAQVEHAIRSRVSGVVQRGKALRPPGAGELHRAPESHQGRDDAMVEMLLLAQTTALIRYPPGSFFSFYGAVMRPSRDPSPPTIYDLQRPYDRNDPLGPAILF